MRTMLRTCSFALLSFVSAFAAPAQGGFCLGGDLEHLSVSERQACTASLAQVRTEARRLGVPAEWHFVVVCGEQGWADYAAFSRKSAAQLEHVAADTDLYDHATFLRSERLGISATGDYLTEVLRREAGLILARTEAEGPANAKPGLRKPEPPPAHARENPTLIASR